MLIFRVHRSHHYYRGGVGALALGALVAYAVAQNNRNAAPYGYAPVQRQGQAQAYAQAFSANDQIVLGYNTYSAYMVGLKPGDRVEFEAQVTQGVPIDLFLLDDANFEKYRRGEDFQYYRDFSELGMTHRKYAFNATTMGRHIFVLDNTFMPQGRAHPDLTINDGKVNISLRFTSSGVPERVA